MLRFLLVAALVGAAAATSTLRLSTTEFTPQTWDGFWEVEGVHRNERDPEYGYHLCSDLSRPNAQIQGTYMRGGIVHGFLSPDSSTLKGWWWEPSEPKRLTKNYGRFEWELHNNYRHNTTSGAAEFSGVWWYGEGAKPSGPVSTWKKNGLGGPWETVMRRAAGTPSNDPLRSERLVPATNHTVCMFSDMRPGSSVWGMFNDTTQTTQNEANNRDAGTFSTCISGQSGQFVSGKARDVTNKKGFEDRAGYQSYSYEGIARHAVGTLFFRQIFQGKWNGGSAIFRATSASTVSGLLWSGDFHKDANTMENRSPRDRGNRLHDRFKGQFLSTRLTTEPTPDDCDTHEDDRPRDGDLRKCF